MPVEWRKALVIVSPAQTATISGALVGLALGTSRVLGARYPRLEDAVGFAIGYALPVGAAIGVLLYVALKGWNALLTSRWW